MRITDIAAGQRISFQVDGEKKLPTHTGIVQRVNQIRNDAGLVTSVRVTILENGKSKTLEAERFQRLELISKPVAHMPTIEQVNTTRRDKISPGQHIYFQLDYEKEHHEGIVQAVDITRDETGNITNIKVTILEKEELKSFDAESFSNFQAK